MSVSKLIGLAAQLTNIALKVVNYARRKRYLEDPARTVAGDDGRVQQSDKSFSELAERPERHQAE
jgi:hypothetical protein